jgi:hypothetical protein
MKKETEKMIIELNKEVEFMAINQSIKDMLRNRLMCILACETNNAKCGKVDLYKYVDKDKNRPIMHGVFHKDGKVYASDGRILCRLSRTYDEANEGKVIEKTGKEIEGRYPNADSVIPNTEGWKAIPADFDKINEARKTWEAHKKLYKKNAKGRFIIGNQEVAMDYLFMMADLMMELGISEFLQYPKYTREVVKWNNRSLVARNDENDIIIMPVYPYYDEWKEHAETEPEYLFIEL